jgi:hypothetical protein
VRDVSEREAVLAQAAIEAKDWGRATAHAEASLAGGYAPALQLLAACAYKRRDYRQAIALLEELGENGGGAPIALLIRLHLLVGDAAKGWDMLKECCRSKTFGPALYDLPRWSGEALAGQRIVAWGGGYGDDILFARFLPPLIRAGAQVAVNCRPGLIRLLQGIPGIDEVQPLETAIPWADYQVQTAELPALLGTGADCAWPGEPYLRVEPAQIAGEGIRIGLVWGSDARHWESEDRTAALADMISLAAVPGVTLYSLQVGAAAAQASPPPAGMRIVDLASGLRDFADTAAAILGLDLVITIDTAVANLAGALGARVWVALPFIPDFRWGVEGDRTPWFPSARCFRQPKPGDWRSVFLAMAEELHAFPAERA